jgi:hypothetical protein
MHIREILAEVSKAEKARQKAQQQAQQRELEAARKQQAAQQELTRIARSKAKIASKMSPAAPVKAEPSAPSGGIFSSPEFDAFRYDPEAEKFANAIRLKFQPELGALFGYWGRNVSFQQAIANFEAYRELSLRFNANEFQQLLNDLVQEHGRVLVTISERQLVHPYIHDAYEYLLRQKNPNIRVDLLK